VGSETKHQAVGSVRVSPRLLRHPVHFLSLGLGSGLAPVAPGTFGTVAALPLYLLLRPLELGAYLAVVAALFLLGVALCGRTARALGVHDHPAIVWDEVVGYLVTMTAAPGGWFWPLVGFALFRLFDIVKPWPVRTADRRVGGGGGIMLDDLLAGLYAALVLQGIALFVR
jgi:phosphatidylglycerophosphatase A